MNKGGTAENSVLIHDFLFGGFMKDNGKKIKEDLIRSIDEANERNQLIELKTKYLGKNGIIPKLGTNMSKIDPSERKEFGILLNDLKNLFNELFENKLNSINEELKKEQLKKEKIDITLPSTKIKTGNMHPLSLIIKEVEDLFVSMGYDVESGPEIESDLFNFEKLNIAKDHPARDMQDSFYITDDYLLRTQTSPVQVRTMLANKEKGPIRIICPGKVFRKDDDDMTHSHQFTQIEGLLIDKDINVSHLKGTLEHLVKRLFGDNREIRLRPSYFPFTEPSMEIDVSCFKCDNKGCPICKQTGWIEVLGAGMVHPNVLRDSGYDPDEYTGFAFGMGAERLAMLKYGINDIRDFYTNNINFLNNFNRIERSDSNESK